MGKMVCLCFGCGGVSGVGGEAHVPLLSNCKGTGEEPSSLHKITHTKHTHVNGYKTQHSTLMALHTLNNRWIINCQVTACCFTKSDF